MNFLQQAVVSKLRFKIIQYRMTQTTNGQLLIKRYARLLLAVFVLSVINMVVQLPAHAAMQQTMVMTQATSHQMQDMMHNSRVQDCKCPPAMCATVASLSNQSIESLSSISFGHLLGFQSVYFNYVDDVHHQSSAILLNHHERQYRQFSPPPLSFSTVLHI